MKDSKTEIKTNEGAFEIKSKDANIVECAFMFLTNLTKEEPGQKSILGVDKTKGLILESLWGM